MGSNRASKDLENYKIEVAKETEVDSDSRLQDGYVGDVSTQKNKKTKTTTSDKKNKKSSK